MQKKIFTKKKKNLFIINNEIQLLNAKEAKHYYKSENSIFVFLESSHTKDIEALTAYKRNLDCHQLVIVNYNNSGRYINQDIALIKHLKQYDFTNIFIGYFSLRIRQYLSNFIYSSIILIDDGTYTLALHYELYSGFKKRTPSMLKTSSLRKKKNVMHFISYYKNQYLRKFAFYQSGLNHTLSHYQLNFFTIYNLTQYCDEVIIKNNYTLLHMKYPNNKKMVKKDSFVYFLGQPLHKSLGLSASDYKSYLIKVIHYYKNKNIKIKYIPHRSENFDYQDVTLSLVSDYFSIMQLNKPFELYLLEEPLLPPRVASFYSSALFTSKHIYSSLVVDSFMLKFDMSYREDIALIYKAIQKENIALIKI